MPPRKRRIQPSFSTQATKKKFCLLANFIAFYGIMSFVHCGQYE